MLPYIAPSAEAKRFLPIAAMLSFAGFLAAGRQLDLTSAVVIAILVPTIAFGLSLLFVPAIRALSSPERVLLKLSQDVTRDYAKKYQIPRRRRERIRQLLVAPMRPGVSDQMEEFWATRAKAKGSQLDKDLELQEVGLFSLGVLGGFLFVFGFGSLLLAASGRYGFESTEAIRNELLVGLTLMLVGAVFLFAFERERVTYRRLLWEKLPLLMLTTGGPDADYWRQRKEFIETHRVRIGEGVANRLAEEADERHRLAVKGEFERDWIRYLLERQTSEDSKIAKALLPYLLRAQGTNASFRAWSVSATIAILLALTVILALIEVAAAGGQSLLLVVAAPLSVVALAGLYFLVRRSDRLKIPPSEEEGK